MKAKVIPYFWESNLSFEKRIEWIAKLASISYGNENAKDPVKLVKRLVKRGHQSLFEFIRCPFENPLTGRTEGYKITDSLRHNIHLPTFSYIETIYGYPIEILKHTFQQSLLLVEIECPIFVDRQAVRHRQTRIEMSRRYVKPDKIAFSYWFPEEFSDLEKEFFTEEMNQRYQRNLQRYGRAELARFDQPLNLYTRYYVLREFDTARNFYVRRFSKHAQKEIRELAYQELNSVRKNQPEFQGQYVLLADSFERIHILDLKKYGEENGLERILVEYGDSNYYAVFDVESGLFVDDQPKNEKYMLAVMFGISEGGE